MNGLLLNFDVMKFGHGIFLWNCCFAGITGPVAIDALGDRIADFDIFHMQDPNTRIFTVTDFLQHLHVPVKMTTYV